MKSHGSLLPEQGFVRGSGRGGELSTEKAAMAKAKRRTRAETRLASEASRRELWLQVSLGGSLLSPSSVAGPDYLIFQPQLH